MQQHPTLLLKHSPCENSMPCVKSNDFQHCCYNYSPCDQMMTKVLLQLRQKLSGQRGFKAGGQQFITPALLKSSCCQKFLVFFFSTTGTNYIMSSECNLCECWTRFNIGYLLQMHQWLWQGCGCFTWRRYNTKGGWSSLIYRRASSGSLSIGMIQELR